MDLIRVEFCPFLCLIIPIVFLPLISMIRRLSDLLWVHFVKHFFWGIELILFLYDITLIDVSSFETWWFYMMLTKRWLALFSLWENTLDILHFTIFFFLFFFVKYFSKVSTIIRESFSITKFHLEILLHLFLSDSDKTFTLDFIFVEYLLIVG